MYERGDFLTDSVNILAVLHIDLCVNRSLFTKFIRVVVQLYCEIFGTSSYDEGPAKVKMMFGISKQTLTFFLH